MNALDSLLDSPFAYHLGWTLVHFLWQGLLVGAAYACLRPLFKDAAPQSRYWLSLGTLAALASLPVFTFLHLSSAPVAAPVLTGFADNARSILAEPPPSYLDALREALHPLIPWTVPAWCAGVILLALKSFIAWRRARILTRRDALPAPEVWQETLARLALRVGVRVRIGLRITAKVAVPCVVGWLKPVILLPPSAFTGLTPLQLEMVLAHELSHIRRLDYLVNLIQVGVETLLFYHPVVRWISRDIRRERELCCDDSAVQACGDALHYAHALTDLELLRGHDMSPALGVNGGDLLMRVERLITPHHATAAPRLTGVMLITALCLGGMLALASTRNMPLSSLQSFSLPHLRAMSAAGENLPVAQAGRQPLEPTEATLGGLPAVHHASLGTVQFNTPELEAVAAPAAPPAPVPAALPVVPMQAGGSSLASLFKSDANGQSALDMNKRAPAQMRIVNVNGSGSEPRGGHEYCEPITGSRVCN